MPHVAEFGCEFCHYLDGDTFLDIFCLVILHVVLRAGLVIIYFKEDFNLMAYTYRYT